MRHISLSKIEVDVILLHRRIRKTRKNTADLFLISFLVQKYWRLKMCKMASEVAH